MSDMRIWRCDRCGFEMIERHCKVQCPNCGARWDCSDVTIWVGDAQAVFSARRLREGDHTALARAWPSAPSMPSLKEDASGAWVLTQAESLRGYAALFPVPGLQYLHHLQGEVQEGACPQGATELLRTLLDDVDAHHVRQITFAVDSLTSSTARFLMGHGFRLGHEEWQMEHDLPLLGQRPTLPEFYSVRTLPYPQAVEQFLRLYDASFASMPWYQPYDRAEIASELKSAADMLFLCQGEKPVGFAWLRRQGAVGEVEPMGIAPAHQGKGAGRALFLEALWRFDRQGLRKVAVGVWRDNRAAIALYRGAGLKRVSRRYYLVYDLV